MPLPQREVALFLYAWGHYAREEVEAEVGLPSACPSCRDYITPPWGSPPGHGIGHSNLVQACWTMGRLRERRAPQYADLARWYRDGLRVPHRRLQAGQRVFAAVWEEWDGVANRNDCD